MTYAEFKNMVLAWPIVRSRDLTMRSPHKQAIRNQLERWHSRKLLIKLRRGVFLLNENDRRITPSRAYIANRLYGPSYVSLEYALNYYGLIPERVTDLTSVTARKTLKITNEIGTFAYQHLKTGAFRGYKSLKDESGLLFFIAEPEKAILDFCYLNMSRFTGSYDDVLTGSYRLQNIETLDAGSLRRFAAFFGSAKLTEISESLCKLAQKEGLPGRQAGKRK